MIRALHVIDTGGPGGAETTFLQALTGLDPAHFESVAVIGDTGWLADELRGKVIPSHIVPANGTFNVRYLAALLRLARKCAADVILAHLYGPAVYASMVGTLLAIPVVSVLHGHTDVSDAERFSSIKSAIVRKGSRRVVFVSRQLQDHFLPKIRLTAAQCSVIPNGVDTATFRPNPDQSLRSELNLPADTILVGTIGNVREPKAYDVLLRAARTLIDRPRNVHFVIAGDSKNALGRQLIQLRRDLDIERHVTFLGFRPDVSRILNNLDVFVLSSHTEGFSIACIEAMACGVPVVSTRSGGPEQILKGNAGILVPPDVPDSIASAIEQVVSSKTLAASLAATALERVQNEYSLSKMLSRYEALLNEVVTESKR